MSTSKYRDFLVTRNLAHFGSKICDLGNIGWCRAQRWENKINSVFFSSQDNVYGNVLHAFIDPKSDDVDSSVCDKVWANKGSEKRVPESDFAFLANNTK